MLLLIRQAGADLPASSRLLGFQLPMISFQIARSKLTEGRSRFTLVTWLCTPLGVGVAHGDM